MAALTAYEQRLVDIYKDASTQIEKDIKTIAAKGNNAQFKKALKKKIDVTLNELENKATEWAEEEIPQAYARGIEQTRGEYLKQAAAAGVEINPEAYPAGFSVLHQGAIEALINQADLTINKTITGAGRRIKDVIQEANKEAITTKILTGNTVQKTKKILVDKIEAQGIKAIKRKDGSYMSINAYAETVAISTTREATNLASVNETKEIGSDLVKMSEHSPTCPICLPLQGRVYSISGNSTEYPALGRAWTGEYANVHPRCKHVFSPYIEEFKTPGEIQTDKKKSNKPFEVEEWSTPQKKKADATLNAYNKQQKYKRGLWSDRQQYNKYRAALGDKAPKSFAGFRSMKKANSDNFKKLKATYREQGRLIKELDNRWIVSDTTGKIKGFNTKADALNFSESTEGINTVINSNNTYLNKINSGEYPKVNGVIKTQKKAIPGKTTKTTKVSKGKTDAIEAAKGYKKIGEGNIRTNNEVLEAITNGELEAIDEIKYTGGGNKELYKIREAQGFNKKPVLLNKKEYEEIKGLEVFRGVEEEGKNYKKAFKEGIHHPGRGAYGDGTYTAIERETARTYATSENDIIQMKIKDIKKYKDFEVLEEEQQTLIEGLTKKRNKIIDDMTYKIKLRADTPKDAATFTNIMKGWRYGPFEADAQAIAKKYNLLEAYQETKKLLYAEGLMTDLGNYAAYRGYEGMYIRNGENKIVYYIIQNRSTIAVLK